MEDALRPSHAATLALALALLLASAGCDRRAPTEPDGPRPVGTAAAAATTAGAGCSTDADCDDGDPCSIGTCRGGKCVRKLAPGCCFADHDCDDSDRCTADMCSPDGLCSHTDTCHTVCCGETGPVACDAGACGTPACSACSAPDGSCEGCCYGAEINPTGDPIGGGPGYSDVLSAAGADWVVADVDGLLGALGEAVAGEVVYVLDDVVLDLDGYEAIEVAGGVTLASGRGGGGSPGALLTTSTWDTYPLFVAGGPSVRFTGLRIRGPDPEIGDHDYGTPPLSEGIRSDHEGLEVDNCEVWAWGYAAINLRKGATGAHVHHSFIHHNRRAGLGYGVVLDRSQALIEANLFDACRHHIAATGRPGTSYEARFNIILHQANSHYFDMHGAADYNKYITSSTWRFDEGAGEVAADTSVFHDNDCALVGMDPAAAWVPGKIGTALTFDGGEDRLECGADSSLVSAEGSIELWLRDGGEGGVRDLVNVFEDSWYNYLLVRLDAAGRVYVRVEDDDVELVSVTSEVVLTDDAWHHLVVTQDGGGVAVYVDGEPSPLTGPNGGAWSAHLALADVWIGNGHWDGFAGTLDEVRFYSAALDPDEIQLHFSGSADAAGNCISIHHNTFRGTKATGVVIRGVPADGAWITGNWFHDPSPAKAVKQTNAQGNLFIGDNHHGPTVPAGVSLPQASGSAAPPFGPAPLEVALDSSASAAPDGELVAHRWDLGDGTSIPLETASATFDVPGRYPVALHVSDALGVPASDLVPVRVHPEPGARVLSLWVKDSYRGELAGYYAKQVLLDGVVVWEEDVAGDEGWTQVLVDVAAHLEGKSAITLTLRAQNLTGVYEEELIELFVYWDDVELFGAALGHGDFEGPASTWTYSEGTPNWSGSAAHFDSRSGTGAYYLYHSYKQPCPEGSWSQIEATVAVLQPEVLGDWPLDEGQGPWIEDHSLYGHHGLLSGQAPDAGWSAGAQGALLDLAGRQVDVPASAALQSPTGTVALWMLPGPVGDSGPMLELSPGPDAGHLRIDQTADARVHVTLEVSGVPEVTLTSPAPLDAGALHHVAVTQDGTGPRLFVDGQLAAADGSATAWTDALEPPALRLGGGAFAGALGGVWLSATPLHPAAVQQLWLDHFPVGVWHLDEGSGTVASDSSGQGLDATLVGMDPATAWVAGQQGAALAFDGVDDRLDVPGDPALQSPRGTIAFWMRADVPGQNLDVINLFEDGYQNYLLVRRDELDRLYLRIEDDDVGLVNVASSATLSSGVFHHVAITCDGAEVVIYLDGVPDVSAGASVWTEHLDVAALWIGDGHWGNFVGVLDELRWYRRALGAGEIAALVASGEVSTH